MKTILEYILLLIIVLFLQIFLLDNLQISTYIHPFLSVAFVIMLPIEIKGAWLLLLSFAVGAMMDLLTGMPGINTISMLFMGFCRPAVLMLMLGKKEVEDAGIPNSNRIGIAPFVKYVVAMVLLHNSLYFILERMTWDDFHITLFRILLSTIVSTVLVYFCQLMFIKNKSNI